MGMGMFMPVVMAVRVIVGVRMGMRMRVRMTVILQVAVLMPMLEVDVEFGSCDSGFFASMAVKMVAGQVQLPELGLELGKRHTQVEQGSEEHVAADAAEDVEVEVRHGSKGENGVAGEEDGGLAIGLSVSGGVGGEGVDLGGGVPGAETVVDVHHGEAAGAGIEGSEQG